jgi:hypothetical protein
MASNLLTLGAGLAVLAAAVDMNQGLYVGDCGPKIQCSIEIEAIQSGKTYRITYEAGVAHKVDSTFCKVSGIATLHKGKAFVGEFGPGKPFEILKKKGYDMSLSRTDNRPCGEPLKVNGVYEAVGD